MYLKIETFVIPRKAIRIKIHFDTSMIEFNKPCSSITKFPRGICAALVKPRRKKSNVSVTLGVFYNAPFLSLPHMHTKYTLV